ncbi:hypothetical protein FACS18949_14860 [Clostridia bacterium]|nr:hypothetical protein FACS189425_05020 [Clostridia bacterium]GHV35974.1 hypothetical protein FACS18949_14860 [Clostridia bacterium]
MPSGGKRPGAGRPRKPLVSRLQEGIGAVSHKKPKVLEFPEKIKTGAFADVPRNGKQGGRG